MYTVSGHGSTRTNEDLRVPEDAKANDNPVATVRIDGTFGRLPPFWDRSVVFFANLLALFYGNEGATQELMAKVGAIESYGGRLCPLLNLLFKGPDNLLVLQCQPDPHLLRYFTDDIGLRVPEVVFLHHSRYPTLEDRLRAAGGDAQADPALRRIARHSGRWFDGFVTDNVLTAAAAALGRKTITSRENSRRGNNKLLLHRFLQEQGLPVFDTETAECMDHLVAAAAALRKKGYRRLVVKSQVGASGIGMRTLDAANPELDQVEPYMFYEGACLVQGWLGEELEGIRRVGSPSIQMFLDETTVWLYDVTEQILSPESVHEGNLSPPPYGSAMPGLLESMRDQAAAVGQWLHDGGYRGTASADFLVVERQRQIEIRLCEVNARVTGATYPAVLARHFCPGGAWLMRNLRFDPPVSGRDLLEALRRKDHLYGVGSEGGVLPINFNADDSGLIGKGQFLCLGPTADVCSDYLRQSSEILPVTWSYDRD